MTKKKVLPKVLTLDYKKWVCGDNELAQNGTQAGKGDSQLLNNKGFMCCLGQFALQSGCSKTQIKSYGSPEDMNVRIQGLSKLCPSWNTNKDTKLSYKCIAVNDDKTTSVALKVKRLQSIISKNKRTLKLKNFPSAIKKEIAAIKQPWRNKNVQTA